VKRTDSDASPGHSAEVARHEICGNSALRLSVNLMGPEQRRYADSYTL